MIPKIKYNSADREWDHCDQCIFYISCLRKERSKGKGCGAYSPYPYKKMLENEPCAPISIVMK